MKARGRGVEFRTAEWEKQQQICTLMRKSDFGEGKVAMSGVRRAPGVLHVSVWCRIQSPRGRCRVGVEVGGWI